MGMGYSGYVKIGTKIILTTGSSVEKVIEPIYSDAVRGAGWYNPGTSKYAEDIVKYDGSIDFDLHKDIWSTLVDWIVEKRNIPKQVTISPDGLYSHLFSVSGNVYGAWNASANFSTSEGSFITCSLGVLCFDRSESTSGDSYVGNDVGIEPCQYGSSFLSPLNPGNTNFNPIPYWKSTAEIKVGGVSPFDVDTSAVEWNISVNQELSVVYACVKAQGPIAVFVGEMDVSGSCTMYNASGVNEVTGSTSANTNFAVTLAGVGAMSMPAVVLNNDSYNVSGGDSIISRAFSMRGLAGNSPAFLMT